MVNCFCVFPSFQSIRHTLMPEGETKSQSLSPSPILIRRAPGLRFLICLSVNLLIPLITTPLGGTGECGTVVHEACTTRCTTRALKSTRCG